MNKRQGPSSIIATTVAASFGFGIVQLDVTIVNVALPAIAQELGTAVAGLRTEHPDFGGTVNFIFQPAEEGLGGGKKMVEEGLFESFPVDAVYGMHNMPGIPVGHFHTRTGSFLAASASSSPST